MSAHTSTILIAEDDPAHAELVKVCLQEQALPATLFHVSDGEQALDYLYKRGQFQAANAAPRPDLVLIDLRMPRMNGFDLLRAIKSDNDLRKIPAVVLTTSESRSDIEAVHALNANSYVIKPLNLPAFQQMIADLCKFWLTWHE